MLHLFWVKARAMSSRYPNHKSIRLISSTAFVLCNLDQLRMYDSPHLPYPTKYAFHFDICIVYSSSSMLCAYIACHLSPRASMLSFTSCYMLYVT